MWRVRPFETWHGGHEMPNDVRWSPPPIITQEYPGYCFTYAGTIEPWRATPAQWRRFRMQQARARGTHSQAEWEQKKNEIGRCMLCGATDLPLTKDHIIPVSRGGCDCIHNLQPLCSSCNSSKGNVAL